MCRTNVTRRSCYGVSYLNFLSQGFITVTKVFDVANQLKHIQPLTIYLYMCIYTLDRGPCELPASRGVFVTGHATSQPFLLAASMTKRMVGNVVHGLTNGFGRISSPLGLFCCCCCVFLGESKSEVARSSMVQDKLLCLGDN